MQGQKKGKKMFFLVVVGLLILAGVGGTVYYYKQYKKIKENPQVVGEEETQVIVGEVGKLMELPGDETPSLATVQDVEKLRDQKFFEKADNGDKLLIYSQAMKAILYRPGAKKIIEVAPLILNQTAENSQTGPDGENNKENQEENQNQRMTNSTNNNNASNNNLINAADNEENNEEDED